MDLNTDNCKELNVCLCCNKETNLFLDLGDQPLANNYHEENIVCDAYPLKLMYCPECFHCQLSHAVNPEVLFKTYKYVSGTSQTGLDFFKKNAEFITNYKKHVGRVLDIASNDGTQLDFFKELGWTTYGVDPATNLCPIAINKGHNIICDFWNELSAKQLPTMDVITAQNVFAHTQYVDDFLQNCKLIMDDKTSLFIQTSQKNMIVNTEFDTTYHEHISFYNTKSMKTLVERNGLYLNRILEADIHGHSYIFEISKTYKSENNNVNQYLIDEEQMYIYEAKTYYEFNLKTQNIISNLKAELSKYSDEKYKCIGFGAAAKGQTLLCYANIFLDYIIDENPLKIGLFSPKMNIPIVNIEHFINDTNEKQNNNKFVIVILAWNFAKEIKEKIKKNKGDKEIIIIEAYFPKLIINKLL
jgi:2-polyprenyl-3-methyl-5-hydroxy-6-metoxy-1,4-benzoquinol methylase